MPSPLIRRYATALAIFPTLIMASCSTPLVERLTSLLSPRHESEAEQVIDDAFCRRYGRVIKGKSDSDEIKRLSRALGTRVLSNEVVAKCVCDKWDNPVCNGN
jgi:hypothetical protein